MTLKAFPKLKVRLNTKLTSKGYSSSGRVTYISEEGIRALVSSDFSTGENVKLEISLVKDQIIEAEGHVTACKDKTYHADVKYQVEILFDRMSEKYKLYLMKFMGKRADRRNEPRHPIELSVEMIRPAHLSGLTAFNVSTNGLFVSTNFKIPASSFISVKFDLSTRKAIMDAKVIHYLDEVRGHLIGQKPGIGLKLLHSDENTKGLWTKYIQSFYLTAQK